MPIPINLTVDGRASSFYYGRKVNVVLEGPEIVLPLCSL
jgi:hypothetical protein